MAAVKRKMLNWASRFNIFCFLDNQDYSIQPRQYECLLAAGVKNSVCSGRVGDIDAFIKQGKWVFGHLSYELKNSLHNLAPVKEDRIGFPLYFFYEPEIVLQLKGDVLVITAENADDVFSQIQDQPAPAAQPAPPLSLRQKISREEYLRTVALLQQHIVRGDCYEINFCQEFFCGGCTDRSCDHLSKTD